MPANIIEGNLLNSDAKYIVHQLNCKTFKSAGLAKQIFTKFSYSNIYLERQTSNIEDKPGNIVIRGNGQDKRYIIGIFGQIYPGQPKTNKNSMDTIKHRKRYFFEGLKKIAEIKNLESIAFPFMIGSGLAGGNWQEYKKLIDKFADFLPSVDVKIIKLSGE